MRTFHQLGALRCVCDTREDALAEARQKFDVRTSRDLNTVLTDPEVKAVVIAAPAARHFDLARKCLVAGKDVYVEKPTGPSR